MITTREEIFMAKGDEVVKGLEALAGRAREVLDRENYTPLEKSETLLDDILNSVVALQLPALIRRAASANMAALKESDSK